MSIALYLVRLWWAGGRGEARFHGAPVRLTACPSLGLRIEAVDYAPSADVRLIQLHAEPMRDMQAEEESRVLAYLRSLPP